jgi:hypothetical protein
MARPGLRGSATAAGALRYGAVVLGQFAVPAALLLMVPERLALHARGSFFSIYEVLRRDPQ